TRKPNENGNYKAHCFHIPVNEKTMPTPSKETKHFLIRFVQNKWLIFRRVIYMDLRSGFPYSLLQYGIIASYPSLQQNIATDVAIIGGGISGALTAWYLSQAGFDVVVVDRRHIGMGSTAASTSLLQYEIDVPLYELINKIGEKNATRSYHLCREAIHIMASLAHKLRVKDGFRTKSSFQFASFLK